MTEKPVTRKFLKIIAYILAGIIVLLTIFHFWFVNHAEELIEDMVSSQSNGKVKLKVKKFKFNWFSHKMELVDAVFYSPDTANATVGYHFEVARMKIQVSAVLPIVFEKKIYIDSLHLFDPNVRVTRFRLSIDTVTAADTSFSIPFEMGRIYNSIQDALQVLKVERFQIDNGSFSLINKTRPEEKPVTITRLNFYLDNLQVDSTKQNGERKILFSDNVALQTTNQDILLPDGRHRLSFANFRINILSRLVEFDSCNIVATKGDGAKSSFSIFFDKLKMTNINFDTLYRSEVIKADSVYCINPRFRLDVDLEKKEGLSKPPPLNEMIQQLTGDMQLASVVVQNGSFDINTVREGRPSSFTSDHNNFELQGLRIQKNLPQPLTVERFAMAIRNYENFLRDSTYAIQFDSILLNNNRISLSNFSYKELNNEKMVNQVTMPQFELYGLSWDDLIFDQRLRAERVTLYHPVINYDLTKERKRAQNIFSNLSNLGELMQLNRLDVVDGQVNLALKNNGKLRLQNATIYLRAKKLVAARELTGIKNSIEYLNFKKGSFEMDDLKTNFTSVNFNSINNKLEAETILLSSKDQLELQAKGVSVRSLQLDEKLKSVVIDGINWDQANVNISKKHSKLPSAGNLISLKNIEGLNSSITLQDSSRRMNLFLTKISAAELSAGHKDGIEVNGLHAVGNNFELLNASSQFTIGYFNLLDLGASTLSNLHYSSKSGTDSSRINIPSISLVPDVNKILKGKIYADDLVISEPDMQISAITKNEFGAGGNNPLPESHIGKLTITQPNLRLKTSSDKGNSSLIWNGKVNNNILVMEDVVTSNESSSHMSVGKLQFNLDHFIFTSTKGRAFNAGKGEVKAELSKIEFRRNEESALDWEGTINNLSANNFIIDSLGKKIGKLTVNTAMVDDLNINSASLLSLRELMTHNTQFRLRNVTGSYRDQVDQFEWRNATYDKRSRRFSLDSISYHPIDDKETYINRQPYQSDYLNATLGRIDIGPFDVERYLRDTVLDMGKVTIQNGKLIDFRDKRVPRKPGTVTLLPVTILKKVPLHFMADTVRIINSAVDYEEVNEKNSQAGRITVERINGRVIRVRNFGLSDTDSLDFRAMGYLQDKIFTRLSLKQSYSDSLGGFLMTGQMGPADLTVLNPVLKPLVSIEIKSASLDSMQMRVIGKEAVAYGSMQLYYHDLKVKVARSGKKEKSILNSLMNFVANTLVRNKNSDKTGRIYFKRLRDRSAINYLVKITLSGFVSNVGIKSNKRAIRKLQKNAKKNQLPMIEAD